jgi:hypothetical protein
MTQLGLSSARPVSPDGKWEWDGATWQPLPPSSIGFPSEYRSEESVDRGQMRPAPMPYTPMQYKVLTQKDRFFAGKFDPLKLEGALNSYAAEGWKVVSIATAEVPGLGQKREELIVVMERPR